MTVATSKASMLSPDARSKSFDAAANGYVRAEGVGLVVLKPLSQALADGDPIVAVIRGSAVNQDGRSKGLTVPSGAAQTVALRAALDAAGVAANEVQYAEAHGTGTPVGDPIEATALGTVLGVGRAEGQRLLMGSVKSNIGHTESAAGVVSLIKVALSLQHGVIPPNLHFHTPNPAIPFDALNLRVPTAITRWPETGAAPRRAMINSFGFGGTNGSMVVEEAPTISAPSAEDQTIRPLLLPLSGKTPEALRAVVERLDRFQTTTPASVADLCYTASQRRGHLPHRAAAVVDSHASVHSALEALLNEDRHSGVSTGEAVDTAPMVVFVFSGMGPQWWAMGRQLLAEEPVFRTQVEAVDAHLQAIAGWSVLTELSAPESESRIQETRIAQPAIFAVQVGLASLWRSWGVEPSAIVGHSVGEAAAAYVSGALPLREAVRVIYHRSRLQQTTAGTGTMLAIGLARDRAAQRHSRHRL
jgi:acyl transferase domain-containing protein